MAFSCPSCNNRMSVVHTSADSGICRRVHRCKACGATLSSTERPDIQIAPPNTAAPNTALPDWDGVGSPPVGYPAQDE